MLRCGDKGFFLGGIFLMNILVLDQCHGNGEIVHFQEKYCDSKEFLTYSTGVNSRENN
jgi:hypothetical protein